jgi:protein TonB
MAFASNDEAACTAMIPPPATNPSSSAPSTRPISPPINRIRIGGSIQASQLITKVTPEIPEELKNDPAASGTVVLHAIIAKDGTVQEMQYVSGPTSLAKVAMDAVRQWTYKPTTLQGQPVEVDTTIAVAFPSPENK